MATRKDVADGAAESFVQIKHAFVEYASKPGLLEKLTGRQQAVARSVLRDIQLSVRQGEWITVFGAPGSGKTTLLRLLTGVIAPSKGKVFVNGRAPGRERHSAAGYVSGEESEDIAETVSQVLHAFGKTHDIAEMPARLSVITEALQMQPSMNIPARSLSTTERLKVNIARAALSDAPVILLDDVADDLGPSYVKEIAGQLFEGRTVIIATRFTATAEELDLPILLLHGGALAHYGTCEDIARNVGCSRVVDVWVEGLRYDLLRALRKQAGVLEVRLLPTDQFEGQRLRITLRSSRYLPSMYDTISQSSLIKVEELPPSLADILARI